MRNCTQILVIFLALCAATSANAGQKEPWKFTIAPYLWGMNLNGTSQIANQSVRVRKSFSDIMQDFKGGGMLWLEADKGKLGLFANGMYAYLNRRVVFAGITFKPVVELGMLTLGASYQTYIKTFKNCTTLTIEPYAGARYTINKVALKVLHTNIAPSKTENWIDPIIGARFTYTMNKNWLALAAGDIGGINFSTQNSYNVNAYIGYVPSGAKCITLYGGYKLLYQNYSNGDGLSTYIWKMHMFGPVVGFSFTF